MITETADKKELLTAIDESLSQLLQLTSALDEKGLNTSPYPDSWTAGELLRHVTKSTGSIAKAMKQNGQPAQRAEGERIAELKSTFLDFSLKMDSPEFIVPEKGPYQKEASIHELKAAFAALAVHTNAANLSEMVEDFPVGAITKLEMLHFVLYHTQRHLHQMKKMAEALNNNQE
jgi:hypothetical protein